MKPLIVLIGAFVLALIGTRIFCGAFDFALSGIISMSAMLLFTAIGHFAFSKGMGMMLPNFVPFKTTIVIITGILEVVAAIGLLIPTLKLTTAWWLIAFFIVILPSNIYAALKKVDYQKGTYDGNGPKYLWFRVPLQILFILWVYFSVLY